MSTVTTFTTPMDGLDMFTNFLCDCFFIISLKKRSGGETLHRRETRKRSIEDAKDTAVGRMYRVVRRMRLIGQNAVAAKMQEVVDMVVEKDLTVDTARTEITAKFSELQVFASSPSLRGVTEAFSWERP